MKLGIVRSLLDAHTLGIATFSSLLEESGYDVCHAPDQICRTLDYLSEDSAREDLKFWLVTEKITVLGFSYRLDPQEGVRLFLHLFRFIKSDQDLQNIRMIFAGLPSACDDVLGRAESKVEVFKGDVTPSEALLKFGVPPENIPMWLVSEARYDAYRYSLAKQITNERQYLKVRAPVGYQYAAKGSSRDSVLKRISNMRPEDVLIRTHAGPYHQDRLHALETFYKWVRELDKSSQIDILSIGASQLTQERMDKTWRGYSNGGGVPISSESEFSKTFDYSGNMLLRSYSGTNDVKNYAKMLDRSINNAWHALSIFWFNQADKRGPLSVKEGIRQHIQTLKYLGENNKIFEPNVAHHFSFRASDDLTSIIATYLSVITAVRFGVKNIILQVMLNTPKVTSGIADIVKVRALLAVLHPRVKGRAELYFSQELDYLIFLLI